MSKPSIILRVGDNLFCKYCKDPIVYGDERNMWIGYHEAWYHRLYWNIKNHFKEEVK